MAKPTRRNATSRNESNHAHNPVGRPTPERLDRGDVVAVEARDEDGWPIQRYHVTDTVTRLMRNGLIEGDWADAVARFRQDHRLAHFQPLGVRDLLKAQTSIGGLIEDRVEDARERVSRAVARLGGLAAPLGSIAWDVIGTEMSLNAWCERQRLAFGRHFRHDVAAGILIGAAGALAAHYAEGSRQNRRAMPAPRLNL